ncbi:antibiotic biosynthesis monooxygenase family protein [Oceanobacillus oncorhynchi subsp. oncorhynchi]|uniref:antibiotic biosynthesis monooxygenase family protein n=1 Tax=Oceanobacillus oncorhynchi TaxID=545501 RepID=UPI0031CE10E0
MKAFMSRGTIHFLETLEKKHKHIDFYFIASNDGGIAYYENKSKNIFSAGQAFDVLKSVGELSKEGYVVMNHLPISEDSSPAFEYRMKHSDSGIEEMEGFQAWRFLRQEKSSKYVVLTQWKSFADFENWKSSDQFKKAHDSQQAKQPSYFMERPFVISGHMHEKEE